MLLSRMLTKLITKVVTKVVKMEEKVVKKKCPICGAIVDPKGVFAHFRNVHPEKVGEWEKYKDKFEDVEVEPEPEPDIPPLPPPKDELEDWFIAQLEKKLPYAIGGGKRLQFIIDTLKEDKELIWSPSQLETHIRQIAGPKINDYMLRYVLTSLYRELNRRAATMGAQGVPLSFLPDVQPPHEEPYIPITPPPPQHHQYPHKREYPSYPQYQDYPPPQPPSPPNESIQGTVLKELIDLLKERGKKDGEEKIDIPNPFGEGTIKVPVSQAPLYMAIKSIQEQIKTLAENLGEKLKPPEPPKEEKIKVDKDLELPADQAFYYLQAKHAEEKSKLLEQRLEAMEQQMLEIQKTWSPERLSKFIEEVGASKNPSPTLDFLDKTRKDLDSKLDRLIAFFEKQARPQAPFQPPQPRYTPEERKRKIKELNQRIKNAEEISELEKKAIELKKEITGDKNGGKEGARTAAKATAKSN